MWRASRTERQAGFTLVEILVALAVFAIASVIAYRGLDAVAGNKSALDQEISFWRELGLVFDRMEADFLQSVPHPLRTASGTAVYQALRGRSAGESGFFVELARNDANRSPVHVLYRCEAGRLTLGVAPINARPKADDAGAAGLQTWDLLHDIEGCQAAFLSADNVWLTDWPGNQTELRPRANAIRLTLPGRGRFERIYHLP